MADFAPTVAELAAVMFARTRDGDGYDEAGTFTDETRPSATQAQTFIELALPLVEADLGTVPDRLAGLARAAVLFRAAMLAETSLFPQEATPEESAYATYREHYADAVAAYEKAATHDAGNARKAGNIRTRTFLAAVSAGQLR